MDELVEAVLRWESDGDALPPQEEFRRAEFSFEHVHLPKTTDVEFIEYRPEDGTIQIEGIPPEYDAIVTIARLIDRPE